MPRATRRSKSRWSAWRRLIAFGLRARSVDEPEHGCPRAPTGVAVGKGLHRSADGLPARGFALYVLRGRVQQPAAADRLRGEPDAVHWKRLGDEPFLPNGAERIFRAKTLAIANMIFDRPRVQAAPDMQPDDQVSGTLGLDNLVGKVIVLDYPGHRFCIFQPADVPTSLKAATWADAVLRNAKFLLPLSGSGFSSDAMIFDTGASQFPIVVDLENWAKLTRTKQSSGDDVTIRGGSWGKTVEWKGRLSPGDLGIGPIKLSRPVIYTQPSEPTKFASWPVKIDGLIGNASFYDNVVILDLTEWMRFGVIG